LAGQGVRVVWQQLDLSESQGGWCSTQLGPGGAALKVRQLEGRKARAGECCTQGLKWGREEAS